MLEERVFCGPATIYSHIGIKIFLVLVLECAARLQYPLRTNILFLRVAMYCLSVLLIDSVCSRRFWNLFPRAVL